MVELERAAGFTGKVSPEPGSAESATPQLPSINMNIFGKYTVVKTQGDETETYIVTIMSIGESLLSWIDEAGEATTLVYNKETNSIHDNSSELIFHVKFPLSGSTVTGSGYVSGTFWDEPVDMTFALTKFSD